MAYRFKLSPAFAASAFFPPVCLVTGARENVTIHTVTVWHKAVPGLVPLLAPARFELPFSPGGYRWWMAGRTVVWLAIVAPAFFLGLTEWLYGKAALGPALLGLWGVLFATWLLLHWFWIPRVAPRDATGRATIHFPPRCKPAYDAFCEAYLRWRQSQNRPLEGAPLDTDDWANDLPPGWDQAR